MYKRNPDHSYCLGDGLATLKYRPAAAALIINLQRCTNAVEGIHILENLLELWDDSFHPQVNKFVESLSPANTRARKAAARILVQIQEQDPLPVLLGMYEREEDELERAELIRSLGRFADQRSLSSLVEIAVSSKSTLLRREAIQSLSRTPRKEALLALVSVMETNAPPPANLDKNAVLDGRPADFSRREAFRALRTVTRQRIGNEPEKWRQWITTTQ